MTTSHDAKTTTDHEEIRDWVQARGGKPASVRGTETGGEEAGVVRIAFDSDSDLEEIGWEEFFDKFDEENLEFLYQDRTADGGESRFFKLIRHGSEGGRAHGNR
ncbi:MAG TPA: hypothetical protein VGK80_10745 [Rhodanobacteraceae bacterium]